MTAQDGLLYVVATPIGNLGDMTARAQEVLRDADIIAAEDTRHSGRLLSHFGITSRTVALHEHNEARVVPGLVQQLQDGAVVALISDAGTPLLSDPGFVLVQAAAAAGVRVLPVPGASALTAALSVAGLATDRFVFEGFLPARPGPRRQRLDELAGEGRTLVFYEAPHRLLASIEAMAQAFGGQRQAVLARELTKVYETVTRDRLEGLAARLQAGQERRGESVVLVAGAPLVEAGDELVRRVLEALADELPASRAAAVAARITGRKRKDLYARLMQRG